MATAYERGKRELKRRMDAINETLATAPTVAAAVTEQRMELARLKGEGKEVEGMLVGMKRDMEGLMASFVRCEGVERKHREAVEELVESCNALEEEKDHWHREEQLAIKVRPPARPSRPPVPRLRTPFPLSLARAQQLSALKAQRDIKGRELAKMVASRKVTIESSKVRAPVCAATATIALTPSPPPTPARRPRSCS
jgi:hypothetical protein